MSSFGLGVGSFISGVTDGIKTGMAVKNYQRQSQIDDMELQDKKQQFDDKQSVRKAMNSALDDATAQRNGDLDKQITPGTGTLGGPTYTFGGKVYQDQQQARDAVGATNTVDPLHDYYMKTMAPKVHQQMLQNGDLVGAETFNRWTQDQNVQQGMRHGAAALRAGMMGDWDSFSDNLVKTYNTPGYFEDGYTASGHKVLRNKAGDATGVQLTLKNDKTGKETTQTFNDMGDLYKNFQFFADPTAVFSHGMEQVKQADAAKLKMADEDRKFGREIDKLGVTNNYQVQRDNNNSQLRMAENEQKTRTGGGSRKVQDANGVISMLRASGKSESYIDSQLPRILGLQDQTRNLQNRVDDYIKLMVANNREFSKLPPDQQAQQAMKALQSRDAAQESYQPRPSGQAITPALPKAQQGMGVTLYDPSSNSMTTAR